MRVHEQDHATATETHVVVRERATAKDSRIVSIAVNPSTLVPIGSPVFCIVVLGGKGDNRSISLTARNLADRSATPFSVNEAIGRNDDYVTISLPDTLGQEPTDYAIEVVITKSASKPDRAAAYIGYYDPKELQRGRRRGTNRRGYRTVMQDAPASVVPSPTSPTAGQADAFVTVGLRGNATHQDNITVTYYDMSDLTTPIGLPTTFPINTGANAGSGLIDPTILTSGRQIEAVATDTSGSSCTSFTVS